MTAQIDPVTMARAAKVYRIEIARCCVCNLEFTNKESVETGILGSES
jgi:hypothetical protein